MAPVIIGARDRQFVGTLLSNVAVFDTGVRCAATSFVEREIGDVLDQVFTAK